MTIAVDSDAKPQINQSKLFEGLDIDIQSPRK